MSNIYTDDAVETQDDVRVLLANGKFDSRKPSDARPEGANYDTISWGEIRDRAAAPTSYAKGAAPFIIPSCYAGPWGRSHATQGAIGCYPFTTGDVDCGNHTLGMIEAAVERVMGQVATLIYATASSRPGNAKWRIIILQARALTPLAWWALQTALIEALAVEGIVCDATLARYGQPVFLPNVPDQHVAEDGTVTILRGEDRAPLYYEYSRFDDAPFVWGSQPVCVRAGELMVEQEGRLAAAREIAAGRASGEVVADDVSEPAVAWFNRENDLEGMLVEFGYETADGVDYQSPFASGFSTRVYDSVRWVSLSGSDAEAGVGLPAAGAGVGVRHGRAFELWVKFRHGNDREAALAAVREMYATSLAERVRGVLPRLRELAAAGEAAMAARAVSAGARPEDVDAELDGAGGGGAGAGGGDSASDLGLQRVGGRIVVNEYNISRILSGGVWAGVLRYDTFTDSVMVAQRPPGVGGKFSPHAFSESRDGAHVMLYLQRHWFPRVSSSMVDRAVSYVAHADSYNSLTDFVGGVIAGAVVDGAAAGALDDWLIRFCRAEDTPYVRAIGRKTILGLVARAMIPGIKFDTCLVLVGKQGTRKSTLAEALAMRVEYFHSGLGDMKDKDAQAALRGRWVVELDELAAMRRSEIEQVKSYLTIRIDKYRGAYQKHVEAHARQCIFVATTNDRSFLSDATGSRRFWPVTVGGEIDIDGLRAALPGMLSVAWAAVRGGEQFNLANDMAAAAAEEAEAFTAGDELDGPVDAYLAERNEVSLMEVWRHALGNATAPATSFSRGEQNRLRVIMQSRGWTSARRQFGDGGRKGQAKWVSPSPVENPVEAGAFGVLRLIDGGVAGSGG